MTSPFFPFSWPRPAVVAACLMLVAGGTGCSYFRALGSGAHMDQAQVHPTSTDNRTRLMVVEVTTDSQGQVASITFKRSSGKEGIDSYVAETIRQSWPPEPSKRTVAEITYTHDNGFSQPKLVSSTPVQ